MVTIWEATMTHANGLVLSQGEVELPTQVSTHEQSMHAASSKLECRNVSGEAVFCLPFHVVAS